MRMRRKPWARPELAACPFFVDRPEEWKGRWKEFFPRRQTVYLELGCGKGFFLAAAAAENPGVNYIGIDINSDVLGVARRKIVQSYEAAGRPVDNLALLSHDIGRIDLMMDENDRVERIYIHFCNPWPKARHQKRRLTHPGMLARYAAFLPVGGEVYFKTDDVDLFAASLGYFRETGYEILLRRDDLPADNEWDAYPTEHENMFRKEEKPIHFLIARRAR